MNIKDDKSLALFLAQGNEKAFEIIFTKYYPSLCLYSKQFLGNDSLAEETVQDIFVRIWEKRFSLSIESSLKHYLFTSVRNHCFNQLQHNKIKHRHVQQILENSVNETITEDYFLEPDLRNKIEEAIQLLPPKRKEIFRLSREEGLKYKEIAEQLNISIKTVEAQMGLALKFLREKLKDYNEAQINLFFILKQKIRKID